MVLPLLCSLALSSAPAPETPTTAVAADEAILFDNVSGRQVAFATGPVQPLRFSDDLSVLYTINQPGARLVFLDPASHLRAGQVHIGLGAVSVVPRPGSSELWVVDSIDSCVNVVDPSLRAVVRTIRVGAEPHGLVFTPTGDRAYVTCSAVDRVDVIDAALYQVVRSIDVPARNPRAIAYSNGRAYVASFLSGNGTAPAGTSSEPNAVKTIGTPAPPLANALPDQDLFVIPTQASPTADGLDPSATLKGLGTILFNLHVRPGTSELWIPNTEALNGVHRGEKNFVDGQVVRNRITIVDTSGAAPPRIVDLDAIAPTNRKCAQPTYVAFDPVRPFAYVAGYGSDIIAVLRIASDGTVTWEGAIDLPGSRVYPRGTGPRACAVGPFARSLFVYNKNDNSTTKIDLTRLPTHAGWILTAPAARPLGVDLTSSFERLGRHLFTNARFSASKTSSCASCHVDGHTDGLVWDLSTYLDPEGTPNDQLAFGTDVKGPMVTQSVRRMEDGGPYHWRGEINSTNGFQSAFVGLLENSPGGVPQTIGPDFQYLRRFMDTLAWPPNPRQRIDRSFTLTEAKGARLFVERPLEGGLRCASCHVLPLGASGEIVAETPGGAVRSADVPSLRGVADKLAKPFTIGGAYGTRTELGAGLTHGGAIATLGDAFFRSAGTGSGRHSFGVSSEEAGSIVAFLSSFDTGIAPAAGLMVTAHSGNWSSVASQELPLLREAARRGHCDLVYVRVPRLLLGTLGEMAGTYDPSTGDYRMASASAPRFSEATLLAEAAGGLPVTFLGVPVGMGEPQGLDRDMDGLFDLDEILAGTHLEAWDSDGDDYSDGYEIQLGMNPLVPNPSCPDTVAPALAGPVRLAYATTNTLKIEFETTEFCKVVLSYNGASPVLRFPFNRTGDHHHWAVVGNLRPDTDYQLHLEMRDQAGNVGLDTSTTFRTRKLTLPEPARVTAIDTGIGSVLGVPTLFSRVHLARGTVPVGAGYEVTAATYYLAGDGARHVVRSGLSFTTNVNGVAAFRVSLPPASATTGTLYFLVEDVAAPAGNVPWVRALDEVGPVTVAY